MHINPCWMCPIRKTCDIRKAKVEGVRGLKLTSIKFKCDILPAMFTPGMRVTATLLTGRDQFEATATVMAWKGDKVIVCVDEEFTMDPEPGRYGDEMIQPRETISKAVVKLRPDRITPISGVYEPIVPICRQCRRPMHRKIPGWSCMRYGDQNGEPGVCVAGDPVAWFEQTCRERDEEIKAIQHGEIF